MTFTFLNETKGLSKGSWNTAAPSDLWCYNLHYFDDLNAKDAESRREWHSKAIADWIESNPPAVGTGWDPYPTSLRVVNWIKLAIGGADLGVPAMTSLAVQVRALRGRLEYHLLGNHLFANAKALVFAGLFFEGDEAEGWLDKGLNILAREIPEQILPDGGQFERSPMYHALALEDMLDLVNVDRVYGTPTPEHWVTTAQRMRVWLSAMCHPDGEISFFNDAAFGIAPSPAELERYASALLGSPQIQGVPHQGQHLTHLASSGYLRAEVPDGVLLADVATIGPDYLPAHAHADTLSFELSLFGQRVIVNGGTSRYGTGPERDAERGTPAHSTVTVDGEDSSEVWAGFRVARRARPFDLAVEEKPGLICIRCAHNGYRRLPGKPVHRRCWELRRNGLRIVDRMEGKYRSAVAHYHLHPSVEVMPEGDGSSGRLRLTSGKEVTWRASKPVRIEASHYAPEFGRRLATRRLALDLDGPLGVWLELSW